ncbi:exonuclease SbcCD subunit D [Angustibacter sp. Root456]|uniref:exonuclease SbcCD subunit D n=1 Tax=Angustibacter sp. Root456 TaxID=1736539 RepID=UPI0006F288C0|nr:exonuclease SbcCD subunit D [Angustibacter sp. Root456]KQX66491.1 DNA exonuclease SbcCD subunit SbcD [Angustibacter sp. Root456]
MRILHTSDWHLGRSFHRVGMLEHQAVFLDHLVEVVRSERVDVVVVAGDVYDRALPSVDTVGVLDDALARLTATGARLVVSSGNHDSAQRLGFGGAVLERGGVHLRTRLADLDRPVLLADSHGPVAVYALPYLEPALAAEHLACQRGHEAVLTAAMERVRADLARRGGVRSVVAAHAFVVGGQASESERDISVGGVGSVPASVFDGVDYAALGHLHGRQQISDTVRYSGSPLAYSFGEASHRKGCWLVDLGPRGAESVTPVEAPVPRRLHVLRGELDDLLRDPRHAPAESGWCHVTLTDTARPRHAMEQLRARYPHTLVLAFEPQGAVTDDRTYAGRVRGCEPVDVCCAFVAHVREQPHAAADRALLTEALDGARVVAAERPATGAPGAERADDAMGAA